MLFLKFIYYFRTLLLLHQTTNMFKNKTVIAVIALIIIAVIAVFYFYKQNTTTTHSWYYTFSDDTEPYDLYIVKELLKDANKDGDFEDVNKNFIKQLPLDQDKKATYIAIDGGSASDWRMFDGGDGGGGSISYDSTEAAHLLQFAEQGNTVFLSTHTWNPVLRNQLLEKLLDIPKYYVVDREVYDSELEEYVNKPDTIYNQEAILSKMQNTEILTNHRDTSVELNLRYQTLKSKVPYEVFMYDGVDRLQEDWYVFEPTSVLFQDKTQDKKNKKSKKDNAIKVEVLGTIKIENIEYPNYIRIPLGKGEFLIHTTPIALTNYHLLSEHTLDYASAVTSYLALDNNVYWDSYKNWGSEQSGRSHNNSRSSSPLSYVLGQKPFAYAIYITLALVVLFVLFGVRRRQRIVPVLPVNTNTTLEYAQSIGRLYVSQGSHHQLSILQLRLFGNYLREKYQIHTIQYNEEAVQQIATCSGVDKDIISRILKYHKDITNQVIWIDTNEALIDLHTLLQKFYNYKKTSI